MTNWNSYYHNVSIGISRLKTCNPVWSTLSFQMLSFQFYIPHWSWYSFVPNINLLLTNLSLVGIF